MGMVPTTLYQSREMLEKYSAEEQQELADNIVKLLRLAGYHIKKMDGD